MANCLDCFHWKPCYNGKEWDAAVENPCEYFMPNKIVHCEDCIRRTKDYICRIFITQMKPDDFCSCGATEITRFDTR